MGDWSITRNVALAFTVSYRISAKRTDSAPIDTTLTRLLAFHHLCVNGVRILHRARTAVPWCTRDSLILIARVNFFVPTRDCGRRRGHHQRRCYQDSRSNSVQPFRSLCRRMHFSSYANSRMRALRSRASDRVVAIQMLPSQLSPSIQPRHAICLPVGPRGVPREKKTSRVWVRAEVL